jgi:hypothetical protein
MTNVMRVENTPSLFSEKGTTRVTSILQENQKNFQKLSSLLLMNYLTYQNDNHSTIFIAQTVHLKWREKNLENLICAFLVKFMLCGFPFLPKRGDMKDVKWNQHTCTEQ